MKKILEEIFGKEFKLYQEKEVKLPLYLKDNRLLFDVEIYGQRFVLVSLPDNLRFNISALKKQHETYIKKFNTPVVYGFERITTFQRKSMVENQLPFVAKNGQVFLPFIGTFFSKCGSGKDFSEKTHFTPATQMLFLLMLYERENFQINKGQAANVLGITPMSISRATLQLKKLGIIEEENAGTEIRIWRALSRIDSYQAAEEYLLDPVQKIFYVFEEDSWGLDVTAGEYALSLRSELGYPDYREYAVDKNIAKADKWRYCDPNLMVEKEAVKVQVWRYDPQLFSREDTVDPVSLLCSFKESRDERIHKCLESIKKEIEGWQIEM